MTLVVLLVNVDSTFLETENVKRYNKVALDTKKEFALTVILPSNFKELLAYLTDVRQWKESYARNVVMDMNLKMEFVKFQIA